jgi:hypothetical protein
MIGGIVLEIQWRQIMIQVYEAVYESGAIRLPDDIRLPEHKKFIW